MLTAFLCGILFKLGMIQFAPAQCTALGASQTISSLTAGTSLDDADLLAYVDNSGTPTTKRITWGNATSSLKTFYDTLYSPIFSTSAGLAGLLSDEAGSGGGFVRATSPTIASPIISSPAITVGSDATGDIYYRSAGGFTRLGIGSTGDALSVSGGIPSWSNSFITFPYTASSTFTATTSLQGSSLTNNALIINGLAYQWPSSRGLANTALIENGAGTLTFGNPLKISYAGAGPSASTGYASTTLLTIPSGAMTASSTIRISLASQSLYNGVGGTMYLRTSTGETIMSVACSEGTNGETADCTNDIFISFISASSQKYAYNGATFPQLNTDRPTTNTGNGTASTNFSGAITLVAVAYAPNASNSMNVSSISIEVIP